MQESRPVVAALVTVLLISFAFAFVMVIVFATGHAPIGFVLIAAAVLWLIYLALVTIQRRSTNR